MCLFFRCVWRVPMCSKAISMTLRRLQRLLMLMDGFTLETLGSGCQYVTLIGPYLSTERTAENCAHDHESHKGLAFTILTRADQCCAWTPSWTIVYEGVHIFGRTWTEPTCLIDVTANSFILLSVNDTLGSFFLFNTAPDAGQKPAWNAP